MKENCDIVCATTNQRLINGLQILAANQNLRLEQKEHDDRFTKKSPVFYLHQINVMNNFELRKTVDSYICCVSKLNVWEIK